MGKTSIATRFPTLRSHWYRLGDLTASADGWPFTLLGGWRPDGAEMLNVRKADQLGIRVQILPSPPEPVRTATEPEAINPSFPVDPNADYYDPNVSTMNPQRAEPPQPSGSKTAAILADPTPTSPKLRLEQPEMQPQVLDLASLDAATQVQRRLQERGFFIGLVDGVWGPRSRIALRDFKILNVLGDDDGWDLRTQLALFDDRYRVASAGYIPPSPGQSTTGLFRPFSPPPGSTLHPLNTSDAVVIQSKLFELGYYRKLGDGVWGLASRSALRDLKVANGLASDDGWDGSVEALLTSGRAVPASETPFGEWLSQAPRAQIQATHAASPYRQLRFLSQAEPSAGWSKASPVPVICG